MHKIVLLLSVAVTIAAAFSVMPVAAAKKRKDDSDGGATSSDGNDNEIGVNGAAEGVINQYDGKRFPVRYAAADEHSTATAAEQSTATAKPPKQPSAKHHNAKLLNKLGMKRVRTNGGNGNGGVNHHRKRLASQSRSKYASGGGDGKGGGGGGGGGGVGADSQMFIVKLPPHAHFYDDGSAAAAAHPLRLQSHHHNSQPQQSPYKSLNTVPVGFVSNGKPAKVYHWNLPTIKHALTGTRYKGVNDVVAMQQQQYNHYLQQHQQQQYNLAGGDFELSSAAAGSKIVPRRTLYYKPRSAGKPVKKSYVNNGKPNGFYVVSNKNANATPQYHKIVKAYYGSGDH